MSVMGLSFSGAGPPPQAGKQAEAVPPRPAVSPMPRARPPVEALVITEPAMCAYCFDSIVAQFDGSAAAATPSFRNGSQCVDRFAIHKAAVHTACPSCLKACLTGACVALPMLWGALPVHCSSRSRCLTTAASSSSAGAWAASRPWLSTTASGTTRELGMRTPPTPASRTADHHNGRQQPCRRLTSSCTCCQLVQGQALQAVGPRRARAAARAGFAALVSRNARPRLVGQLDSGYSRYHNRI